MVRMEYKYDPESDCAYVLINDLPFKYSKEVNESCVIDYTEDGTVIGIDLLFVGNGVDIVDLPHKVELKELLEANNIKVI